MKVYEAIAGALAGNEVGPVFGVLGDANMLLVHALIEQHGVPYVKAAREDGAVAMADGYARVSGRLGVATVTDGPSLSNSLTALTQAARNGTPLLLVCGDIRADARFHIQELDQRAAVAPTGAGFVTVAGPHTAADDVAYAVREARAQHRPMVLNVRRDVQDEEAPYAEPPRLSAPEPQRTGAPDDVIDAAAGLVASSHRPLILAGRGAVHARDALARLARLTGAPLATTLLAKDLFRDDPFDIGICGTFSSPRAQEVIARADTVVAFGAGLNPFTTYTFGERRRVVHVEADPTRLGRHIPVDVPIVADAAETATQLADLLETGGERPPEPWFEVVAAGDAAGRGEHDPAARREVGGPPSAAGVARWFDQLIPRERTVVVDGGRFMQAPIRSVHVPDPRAFVFALDFGAIGLGLGSAIGAAFAEPRRPTLAFVGDGGLMMSLTELRTAVSHHQDLVVVVFNDGAYGQEYAKLRVLDLDEKISLLDPPDFAAVAEGMGAAGCTVREHADLEAVQRAIEGRDGPLLVDVLLDPSEGGAPQGVGAV